MGSEMCIRDRVEAGALLLFLAVVVQGSDDLQYLWGKTVGRHRIAPP